MGPSEDLPRACCVQASTGARASVPHCNIHAWAVPTPTHLQPPAPFSATAPPCSSHDLFQLPFAQNTPPSSPTHPAPRGSLPPGNISYFAKYSWYPHASPLIVSAEGWARGLGEP